MSSKDPIATPSGDMEQSKKAAKKVDKPLKNMEMLNLKTSGQKTANVLVLTSKVWTDVNVGIFIDIPITGSAAARLLLGSYAVYAFEKAAVVLYHTSLHGVFNPLMGKQGINAIEANANASSDGAPSIVRVSLTANKTKAGAVLGQLLARVCFKPPKGDLASPALSHFPREENVLNWVAEAFCEVITSKLKICIVAGKKNALKESLKPKFETKFGKAFKPISYKGTKAPGTDVVIPKDMVGIVYPIQDMAAMAVIAQVMSPHGMVWAETGKIGLTIHEDNVPDTKRALKPILSNKAPALINWFIKFSARDPLSGNSSSTMLAIAGVASGLPVDMAHSIAKGAKPSPDVIGGKIEALVKPKPTPKAKPSTKPPATTTKPKETPKVPSKGAAKAHPKRVAKPKPKPKPKSKPKSKPKTKPKSKTPSKK